MSDFEYVVNPVKPSKICFGSIIERHNLPIIKQTLSKNIGPSTYNTSYFSQGSHPILKKVVTKKGYGNLASQLSRFILLKTEKRPDFYDLYEPPLKKSKKPFGRSMKQYNTGESITPGVGSYNIRYQRKNNQRQTFGGPISIIPAVQIICNPTNNDKCLKCEKTPVGDYWKHFIKKKNLCRKCMNEEILIKKNNLTQMADLNDYKRVRYCGFYHDHQNTTACVKILPKNEVIRKIRSENYLSKFYM